MTMTTKTTRTNRFTEWVSVMVDVAQWIGLAVWMGIIVVVACVMMLQCAAKVVVP